MHVAKLICVSMLWAAVGLAEAAIVTKSGIGEAAMVGGDEQSAFESAKERALRAAIEQAAGVSIDADTVVVNNQLVRDQVFARTAGYVKSFEVVSRKKEKNVVLVEVRAEIITRHLDQDIEAAKALVKRMGRPSVVIVVQEQTVPLGEKVITTSDTAATVLTEAFRADGWDIKDPQAMNKKLKLEAAATLGASEMKEISDLTLAHYVLYGKVVLRHQEAGAMVKGATFFPVSGEYDLALASTDDHAQIAKVAGKLVMSQKTDALISYERTAYSVIRDRRDEIIGGVRKAVLEHFRNQQTNGRQLALTVTGLDSFGLANDFSKAIESIAGISAATSDAFAGGKATYRVTFLGSAQDLALRIEKVSFKKKKMTVTSVSANALEIKVGK